MASSSLAYGRYDIGLAMQTFRISFLLIGLVNGFVDYGSVYPEYFASGKDISLDTNIPYHMGTIKLSPSNPVLTMDYGTEVAGFPFFDVSSLSGPTQVEVKYAESFVSLENPNSDGPWTFNNGLSNTFRVETFNLSSLGRIGSSLLQGGLRWTTIRLLTDATVEFRSIGFRSTASHVSLDVIPGKLKTSNDLYNRIWTLGARAVQVACVDAGNAPSTWQMTSEGAFIPGQQTAQYVRGSSFSNYTLTFATKIVRGGTGWRVASGVSPYGALFYLTSEYLVESTYINTNRTLLPPNTLVFAYGYSIVNQTTLETGRTQYFPMDVGIEEEVWYNISTTIMVDGYRISINGHPVAMVSIAEAAFLAPSSGFVGTGSPYEGTWGFGPWNDQATYIKDVVVTAKNGSILYSNSFTTDAVLADYSVAPLDTSVCLDGAKRDRLVWIGDFYHTARIIAASTARWDYILGTINHVFSFQRQGEPFKGFVPINAALGTRPEFANEFMSSYAALMDYQDLFVSAIGNYFWSTGNMTALAPYWNQIKALVSARTAYIDPYSGLVAGENASYFLGPANGSAVTALFAYTLRSLIPLATALNDTATANLYTATASNLSKAINTHLWNPSLGTYSLSLSAPSNYSLTSIAWTLLSATANTSQATSMLAKLPDLKLGVGYKTSSSDPDSATTQLSPNILGFLLEALFKANRDLGVENTTAARSLLDDFWSKMVTQDEYYSGASWEYLYPDGSPGVGLFTSLAHPWGAAPTYVLPEYVLGVSALEPGFRRWRFEPPLGILGLEEASGTVLTPFGGIEASWKLVSDGTEAVVRVSAPDGTAGTLALPRNATVSCEGEPVHGTHVSVQGGKEVELRVHDMRE